MNLIQKLACRRSGSEEQTIAVAKRRCLKLPDLLPREYLSNVVLGFSRCSKFLYTYREDSLRFYLDVFEFNANDKCQLFKTFQIFREISDAQDDSFMICPTNVRISLWEPYDSGCIVTTAFLIDSIGSEPPFHVTIFSLDSSSSESLCFYYLLGSPRPWPNLMSLEPVIPHKRWRLVLNHGDKFSILTFEKVAPSNLLQPQLPLDGRIVSKHPWYRHSSSINIATTSNSNFQILSACEIDISSWLATNVRSISSFDARVLALTGEIEPASLLQVHVVLEHRDVQAFSIHVGSIEKKISSAGVKNSKKRCYGSQTAASLNVSSFTPIKKPHLDEEDDSFRSTSSSSLNDIWTPSALDLETPTREASALSKLSNTIFLIPTSSIPFTRSQLCVSFNVLNGDAFTPLPLTRVSPQFQDISLPLARLSSHLTSEFRLKLYPSLNPKKASAASSVVMKNQLTRELNSDAVNLNVKSLPYLLDATGGYAIIT
jgi:hypothetical protein